MAGTEDCLPLVHVDDSIVVLNKPAGLLSVPGRTEPHCLSALVQRQIADALVVHRLDMATSGLLVMARGRAAQRALHARFAARQVHKRYVALVQGDCRPACGAGAAPDAEGWLHIDLPIRVDWPNRPLRVIDTVDGKPSSTRWRCLAYDPQRQVSRLALEPLTGRSHQLRVHLQALGHPILGDALYAPASVAAASPRLLLHACELGFVHPGHGAWVCFAQAEAFVDSFLQGSGAAA